MSKMNIKRRPYSSVHLVPKLTMASLSSSLLILPSLLWSKTLKAAFTSSIYTTHNFLFPCLDVRIHQYYTFYILTWTIGEKIWFISTLMIFTISPRTVIVSISIFISRSFAVFRGILFRSTMGVQNKKLFVSLIVLYYCI